MSTIKVTWTAPTTRTGEVIPVDHYCIKIRPRYDKKNKTTSIVMKTLKTEIEIVNINQYTESDMILTIAAESQGRIGPEVTIGISKGIVFVKIDS